MADTPNPLDGKDNRPAGPHVPGWSILLFLFTLPVLGVIATRFVRHGGDMMTMLALFFAVGLAAVVLSVIPLGRAALPALGLRRAGWRPMVLGTLGTLGLSIAVSQLGLEPQGMKDVFEGLRGPRDLAGSLLLLAVLAPLVEELIFRGLLYGWLAGRWGTMVGWIASSLLFAAAHVEPAHIALVLPLGLLFGWLRRRTDSLLPSLVAHVANNGMAVLAAFALRGVG